MKAGDYLLCKKTDTTLIFAKNILQNNRCRKKYLYNPKPYTQSYYSLNKYHNQNQFTLGIFLLTKRIKKT